MAKWYLYCKKADFAGISLKYGISPMLARIIRNRDIISDDEINLYLNGTTSDMYDPFLMKGMAEGVRIVSETIDAGKKIRIVGDYDVDGICSAFILKKYICNIGGTADVRIPNRMTEGYGMNEKMTDEALKDGISLIITCDNGISSAEAVKKARDHGLDVIITDHHEAPPVLPDANAVIDPKQPGCNYPYKEICGGGVAYKFVQGLDRYRNENKEKLLDELLQYAGLATITDIVPLVNENRIFAKEGIKRLRKTSNPGLDALIRIRGIEKEMLSSANIGFIIGPCLNSAGRLKDAMLAFDLLEETDPAKAAETAVMLSELNEERKILTVSQISKALEKIEIEIKENGQKDIMVIYLPEAHESVAGIVAGRIKEEYNRPAIIVTDSEGGLKGSGRSTDYYNMIEGLKGSEELFLKFGGHAKACGFTLNKLGTAEDTVQILRERLNSFSGFTEKDIEKKIWIDMQLPFKYITEDFIKELEKLEPFGLKNEKPVFAGKDIRILSSGIIGKNSNALKLELEDPEGYRLTGIMFGNEDSIREHYDEIKDAAAVSILFYPRINEFRGTRTVQMIIQDINRTQ